MSRAAPGRRRSSATAPASWRVTRTPDVGGARCPPSTCPCGAPPYWAVSALPLPEMPEIAMPVPVMVTIRPTTVSPRMATRALSERRALFVRATRVMARDRARSNSAPVGTGRSVSSSRTTSSAPCGGTPPQSSRVDRVYQPPLPFTNETVDSRLSTCHARSRLRTPLLRARQAPLLVPGLSLRGSGPRGRRARRHLRARAAGEDAIRSAKGEREDVERVGLALSVGVDEYARIASRDELRAEGRLYRGLTWMRDELAPEPVLKASRIQGRRAAAVAHSADG